LSTQVRRRRHVRSSKREKVHASKEKPDDQQQEVEATDAFVGTELG
jgi:hypothetical protein